MAIPQDYRTTKGGSVSVLIALGILALIVLALVMLPRQADNIAPDARLSTPPVSQPAPTTVPAPVPVQPVQ